jgi:hypothetical protein
MKWFIALVLIGAGSLIAYVGNVTMGKKTTESTLAVACATSLTTLHSKLPKQKYVSYGEFNDYVSKRVTWLLSQVKNKKISQSEFQTQMVGLFTSYAPTSMKTCHTILEPSFKKCQANSKSEICASDASNAFTFALKLVFDDAQTLKQSLDLTKIVAFDIRTAVQQTRSRMPASDAQDLKNYAAFLQ